MKKTTSESTSKLIHIVYEACTGSKDMEMIADFLSE